MNASKQGLFKYLNDFQVIIWHWLYMMKDHVANEQSDSMFLQISQSLRSDHSELVTYDGR
jgi:hypothetical protein